MAVDSVDVVTTDETMKVVLSLVSGHTLLSSSF